MSDIIMWIFIFMIVGLAVFFWALANHIKKDSNSEQH